MHMHRFCIISIVYIKVYSRDVLTRVITHLLATALRSFISDLSNQI